MLSEADWALAAGAEKKMKRKNGKENGSTRRKKADFIVFQVLGHRVTGGKPHPEKIYQFSSAPSRISSII
jgi:hypothetical protein